MKKTLQEIPFFPSWRKNAKWSPWRIGCIIFSLWREDTRGSPCWVTLHIYITYYIGRPHALMRGQTSPQSINEKTTTCDRVDMENNNGLSYCEYFMRSGANEKIIKLFWCKYKQTIFTTEQKNVTVNTNNFGRTKKRM